MRSSFRDIVDMKLVCANPILVVGLSIGLLGCNPPKGACTVGSGITRSCGEDFTSGSCGIVNGTFYEGLTCADLRMSTPFGHEESSVSVSGFFVTLEEVPDADSPFVLTSTTCN